MKKIVLLVGAGVTLGAMAFTGLVFALVAEMDGAEAERDRMWLVPSL